MIINQGLEILRQLRIRQWFTGMTKSNYSIVDFVLMSSTQVRMIFWAHSSIFFVLKKKDYWFGIWGLA